MKKFITFICSLFLISNLNAKLFVDESYFNKTINPIALYKGIHAGDYIHSLGNISDFKHFSCTELNLPLAEISKCYHISMNENFNGIDFQLLVSTINDKISTLHLIKTSQDKPLSDYFFSQLFKEFKPYAIFDYDNEEFPPRIKYFMKEETFFEKHTKMINEKPIEDYKVIDSVLLETDKTKNIEFSFSVNDGSSEHNRMVEIMEMTNGIDWYYNLVFINFNTQLELVKEYNSK